MALIWAGFMGKAKCDVLVVGGGPAGLAAAEAAAGAGARVLVAERMPSVGRKFLMAGRSGLNLTKDEAAEVFRRAVTTDIPGVPAALEAFGPGDAVGWAEGLGQEVFTGSSGRVFPRAMKASPLLRAWLGRLDGMGVEVRTRCRWEGFSDGLPVLDGVAVEAGAVVIAAGGASWSRLGSGRGLGRAAGGGGGAVFRPRTWGSTWTGRRTLRGISGRR